MASRADDDEYDGLERSDDEDFFEDEHGDHAIDGVVCEPGQRGKARPDHGARWAGRTEEHRREIHADGLGSCGDDLAHHAPLAAPEVEVAVPGGGRQQIHCEGHDLRCVSGVGGEFLDPPGGHPVAPARHSRTSRRNLPV